MRFLLVLMLLASSVSAEEITRKTLETASYEQLVAYLTARGIGRHLFAWAGKHGQPFNIDITRAMALAEFDKEHK